MYLSPNRARHLLLPFPRATTELLLNFRPRPRAKETTFRAFSGSAGLYHAPKLALGTLGFTFRNGRAVHAGIISNDPSFPGYLSLRPFSGTEHEYRTNPGYVYSVSFFCAFRRCLPNAKKREMYSLKL